MKLGVIFLCLVVLCYQNGLLTEPKLKYPDGYDELDQTILYDAALEDLVDILSRLTPESIKIDSFQKQAYIKFQKLKIKVAKQLFKDAQPERDDFGCILNQDVSPVQKYCFYTGKKFYEAVFDFWGQFIGILPEGLQPYLQPPSAVQGACTVPLHEMLKYFYESTLTIDQDVNGFGEYNATLDFLGFVVCRPNPFVRVYTPKDLFMGPIEDELAYWELWYPERPEEAMKFYPNGMPVPPPYVQPKKVKRVWNKTWP